MGEVTELGKKITEYKEKYVKALVDLIHLIDTTIKQNVMKCFILCEKNEWHEGDNYAEKIQELFKTHAHGGLGNDGIGATGALYENVKIDAVTEDAFKARKERITGVTVRDVNGRADLEDRQLVESIRVLKALRAEMKLKQQAQS